MMCMLSCYQCLCTNIWLERDLCSSTELCNKHLPSTIKAINFKTTWASHTDAQLSNPTAEHRGLSSRYLGCSNSARNMEVSNGWHGHIWVDSNNSQALKKHHIEEDSLDKPPCSQCWKSRQSPVQKHSHPESTWWLQVPSHLLLGHKSHDLLVSRAVSSTSKSDIMGLVGISVGTSTHDTKTVTDWKGSGNVKTNKEVNNCDNFAL